MGTEHRRGGGHSRPGSRGFEAWAWLFMRVSGVVLLFLAVFHLLWMHYVIGVDNLTFQTVVSRWSNPLWRIYDFALLGFALVHGMNGLRMVLEDYIHRAGTLLAVKSVAYVLAFLLLSGGAWIIFSFHVPA